LSDIRSDLQIGKWVILGILPTELFISMSMAHDRMPDPAMTEFFKCERVKSHRREDAMRFAATMSSEGVGIQRHDRPFAGRDAGGKAIRLR